MAQFSKFVRPGYFRIDATYQPTTNVFVVAFKGKDQNVVVAINQNKTVKSPTFYFRNDTIFSAKKYVTSGSKNLNDEGTLICAGNSFSDKLDAQSITTYVTSKISTGANLLMVPEIRIYQDPASDRIQLSSIENVTGLQIYDILGKKINAQKQPASSIVDISSLNSGIYLIRIQQRDKESCFKFVKN